MARLPRSVTSTVRNVVNDLVGGAERHINDLRTRPTDGQRKVAQATKGQRVYRGGQRLAAGAGAGAALVGKGVYDAVTDMLKKEDPDKITDSLIERRTKQVLKKEGIPIPRGRPKAPIPRAKDINLEIANNAKKDIENYYEDKRKNKMALGGMATPSATSPRVSNPARGVAPVSRDLERPTPTSPARRRGPVSRPAVMPTSPIEEYNPRVSNPAKGVAPVSRDLERPTPTSPARRGPVVRPAVMPRKPAEGKGPVVRPAVMPRKPAKGKGPVVRPAVMPTPAKGAAPIVGTLAAATKAARAMQKSKGTAPVSRAAADKEAIRAMQKSKGTAPVSRPAVMPRKPLDVKKQRALANATRFAGSALLGKTR